MIFRKNHQKPSFPAQKNACAVFSCSHLHFSGRKSSCFSPSSRKPHFLQTDLFLFGKLLFSSSPFPQPPRISGVLVACRRLRILPDRQSAKPHGGNLPRNLAKFAAKIYGKNFINAPPSAEKNKNHSLFDGKKKTPYASAEKNECRNTPFGGKDATPSLAG